MRARDGAAERPIESVERVPGRVHRDREQGVVAKARERASALHQRDLTVKRHL